MKAKPLNPKDPNWKSLIEDNRGLVHVLVNRMFVPKYREDATSEGYVALVVAAQKYDPDYRKDGRGVRFSTFATHHVLGALRRYRSDVLPKLYSDKTGVDLTKVPAVVSEPISDDLVRFYGVLDRYSLTALQREVMLLRVIEGLTFPCIAAKYGVSHTVIQDRYKRVMKILRGEFVRCRRLGVRVK